MMAGIETGRINVAARGLGAAMRALELSLQYAQERVAFGKPIAPPPGDPAQARQHGDRGRGGEAPDRRRRAQEAVRRARRRRGRYGEALRHRGRAARRRGRDAHPRRLRVLEGVRDRAPVPRHAAAPDRRGHERDPAADHRPRHARRGTRCSPGARAGLPSSARMGDPVDAVAALADPVRRALYEHVAGAGRRGLAGRGGRGGRRRPHGGGVPPRPAGPRGTAGGRRRGAPPVAAAPAPAVRRGSTAARSARSRSSLPPRDYELAATLLAGAVEEAGAEEAVEAQARALGERLGAAHPAAGPHGPRRGRAGAARHAASSPTATRPASVRLRNCAFHALADDFPVLVCGMNRAFCEGVARGRRPARRAGAPRPARARLLRRHLYRQQLLT